MSPEEREALERMEWAAERWFVAHVRRDDTSRQARLIEEALRDFRRAERRRRRADRKAR